MTALLAHCLPSSDTTAQSDAGAVIEHLPFIQAIARRLSKRLPASVEVDELVNIGVIGLIDALERYDASKGVAFKSYAELRIKGQMIDALRSDDIIPRSVRRKHTRLTQEREHLTVRLGRAPSLSEVRHQLDMEPRAFEAYLRDAHVATVSSLDAPVGDDSSARFIDTVALPHASVEDVLNEKQLQRAVADAVAQLPERERAVVTMYYVQHRNLRQIGERLGVTESRACQLRGQGVKRLQFRLRDLHA